MSETHHLRRDQKLSRSSEPKGPHQDKQKLSKGASHNAQIVKCCEPHKEISKTWRGDKWEISLLKNYSSENNPKETNITIFLNVQRKDKKKS